MFQQTIKNFNIHFDNANERTTFYSGDVLQGHISFEITKEMKIDSITMSLTGKANVHWTSGGKHKRVFNAKLDFFDIKSAVVLENGGRATKLPPGRHLYPFTCQIPQGDFPSSFHGTNGHIVYSLTVSINRPWHFSKGFVTELNFVSRIDTNQPELWAPMLGSTQMTLCCLWCASGPITLTARTEKKAFTPGETVKVICDISSASSRTATPKLKLQQKQDLFSVNKVRLQALISRTITSQTGQSIRTPTSHERTEVMLTIPPSTPLSISNCTILEVSYTIEVTLYVSAAPDLTVLIPIILYDTPINTLPTHQL